LTASGAAKTSWRRHRSTLIPQVEEADRLAGATDLGRHLIAAHRETRQNSPSAGDQGARRTPRPVAIFSSDAEGYIAKVCWQKE
jgi:hypothetical protein